MRLRVVLTFLFTALAAAVPAGAQTYDVFIRATKSYPEGSTQVRSGAAKLELASGNGAEAGLNVYWGDRLSTEIAIGSVHHDLDATAFGQHVDLGATRVTPLSLLFQYHSNRRGPLDFHLGAGPPSSSSATSPTPASSSPSASRRSASTTASPPSPMPASTSASRSSGPSPSTRSTSTSTAKPPRPTLTAPKKPPASISSS